MSVGVGPWLFDYRDYFDNFTFSLLIKEREICHFDVFEITFHNEWDPRPLTE